MAATTVRGQQSARTLFDSLHPLVFQVRIIDIASGDKTSIGSGFRISSAGHVATNFHVIQYLVHDPAKYRLELIGHNGDAVAAALVGIDVLHDLAIIHVEGVADRHFDLLAQSLSKGERIYSMGNPRDLGMTIVEGNYNGPVKTSRFERFLFSGSLNPGMSGGPAFNQDGEVVGINVSTGGEQLSFLVPTQYLRQLIGTVRQRQTPPDFKTNVGQDLLKEQDEFYRDRVAQDWPSGRFGDLMLPRKLSPAMKCWGHNIDDEDIAYESFHQHCRSQEYLFIEDDFYTGNFSYDYEWMTTERLNALQFYTAVEERFSHSSQDNVNDESHATNYKCVNEFVDIDSSSWKASICLRRYKEYEGLHDASIVLVSLSANDQAGIVRMAATGIGKRRALDMFERLMRSITWAR